MATKVESPETGADSSAPILTWSEAELELTISLIREYMETHWDEIQKVVYENDESKGSISLTVKLDHSDGKRMVGVKIKFSQSVTDGGDALVRDPKQMEIEFKN